MDAISIGNDMISSATVKKAKIVGRKLKLSAESLNLIGWQVSRENTTKQNGG